jgi:hypothetical protein
MSQMPIFSYKQYLDDMLRLKDHGTVDVDAQVERPISAGSRGLKRIKDFVKDPVHMMGEDVEGQRPSPASPNPKLEAELLNKPTPTIQDIAKKFNKSTKYILDQLRAGIRVEKEHTDQFEVAMEIALDHLNERPDYYEVLKSAEKKKITKNEAIKAVLEGITYSKTSGELILPEAIQGDLKTWFESRWTSINKSAKK